MCAHSSGMIGFPLRLLAREVYDRVVAIKGAHQVALITGEEKILLPQARWFLCTAESMPTDREVSFVALDEAKDRKGTRLNSSPYSASSMPAFAGTTKTKCY